MALMMMMVMITMTQRAQTVLGNDNTWFAEGGNNILRGLRPASPQTSSVFIAFTWKLSSDHSAHRHHHHCQLLVSKVVKTIFKKEQQRGVLNQIFYHHSSSICLLHLATWNWNVNVQLNLLKRFNATLFLLLNCLKVPFWFELWNSPISNCAIFNSHKCSTSNNVWCWNVRQPHLNFGIVYYSIIVFAFWALLVSFQSVSKCFKYNFKLSFPTDSLVLWMVIFNYVNYGFQHIWKFKTFLSVKLEIFHNVNAVNKFAYHDINLLYYIQPDAGTYQK